MRFLSLFLSLFLAGSCLAGVDFYLWQRQHTGEVETAAETFYLQSTGKLAYLAGELENPRRKIRIAPPDFIKFDRSRAVVRIHTSWMKLPPEQLASEIRKLYLPWQKCKALEIDLDAPESKLDYYTSLMQELRKLLPATILSATVLPCHLKHSRKFTALAAACDFYVLQVHGLNKEKGYWEIFDYPAAAAAVKKARSFQRPFKTALPLYSNNISADLLVKPDLHKVAALAKQAEQVIGFRLGIAGDGNSLDWQTAAAVCRKQGYAPELKVKWEKQSNGAWILTIGNRGYFAENVTLLLKTSTPEKLLDADTFGQIRFDRQINGVFLRLPPTGTQKKIMWVRLTGDESPENIFTISIKDNQ